MAAACCSALSAISGLSIALPHTHAYNAIESSYWSLQESTLTPSCIVTPHSSHSAADVVKTLTASSHCDGVDFAIKGRTHAPAAGFANIDSGVTVDMTGLSSISTNSDHSVATVGAGASWLDVYTYLDPLGKSVAGGRNGGVGVGGLTLGGGISYFSPQVGFTCDTATNFELVLASGDLINANSDSRPDLFRALKGGTNNLGLVTSISFNTVDISKILAGSLAFDISHRSAVFSAFSNIAGTKHYDVHASIVMELIFNSTSKAWVLASTPVYTLPEKRPKVYEELFSVPNISDTLSLTKLHTFANESATPPANWAFGTSTYAVSASLLDQIFNIVNETIYDFSIPEGIVWVLAFEPLPKPFVAAGAGSNSLGTSPADGPGVVLLISPLWPDSSSNAKVHAKAKEILAKGNAEAKKRGELKKFMYANYADASQRPIESYGRENVEFLERTARKYDPRGVFQRKVPGGFKLPR